MARILIAEDEHRIAAFIEKGLNKNGFQTAIASDGKEVLEMLESNKFDILLLDIQLPIKNGWVILEELRSQQAILPIIVMTACFEAKEKIKKISPQHCQNIDYLGKPFRFAELLTRITSII